jgi:hypothetical protein
MHVSASPSLAPGGRQLESAPHGVYVSVS